MKRTLLFLALPLLPLGGFAADNEIRFNDLPKLIKERNEYLKASRAQTTAQEERTGHLTRSFLPKVGAQVGHEEFKVDSDASRSEPYWRVGVSLNLYRGGRDQLDEEIRESLVQGSKLETALGYNGELKKARIAFWEIVATEKKISFRRDEKKSNEESLGSATRRAGAGVSTNADTLQFELQGSFLDQEIKLLELRRDLSRNRLSTALGMDEHENIVIKDDFPQEQALQETESLSAEDQPTVKVLRAREKVEDLRASQAGRWWAPSLDLYASYGVPSLDDEYARAIGQSRETAVSLKLSFDLGEGWEGARESKARSLEAKAQGLRAAYQAREAKAVDHELRHDMKVTAELLEANEKNVTKAREFVKLTRSEYGRGLKNGPDLLAASRQFFELQDRSINLQLELVTNQAELESLIAKEKP